MIAPGKPASAARALRRRQAAGLIWTVLAIILFSALRAGRHAILLPGWWRLW